MSEFKAYFTLNFAVCLYIELGFSLRLMYSLSSINFVSIKKYLMVLVNKQGFSPFFFYFNINNYTAAPHGPVSVL